MDRKSRVGAWTHPEGGVAAMIHEARVLNVNLTNWTVDCITVFDQKRFFDIQVAAPYLHPNTGEGIYVVPDVGAKCVVCIPSDGPPPFVMSFIMPSETVDVLGGEEAEKDGKAGSTYAGGRRKPKPGDLIMQGRDGNFCILHRGGVLQFGATQLAQRICIPVNNLVTDISQNYNHFNTGGAVNWGVVDTSPDDSKETEYTHTFRLYANDQNADVRVAVGKVHTPLQEPTGDDGELTNNDSLNIGKDEPIVFEFAITPDGFDTDNGGVVDADVARDATKLRMFFDRGGGGMLRAEGSLNVRSKEDIYITADGEIVIHGKEGVRIQSGEASGFLKMVGSDALELGTDGGVLKLNGGTKPVATVGSTVQIIIPVPIPIVTTAGPGTITAGAVFQGIVQTGNPTILG
jgi:hypothetical protein